LPRGEAEDEIENDGEDRRLDESVAVDEMKVDIDKIITLAGYVHGDGAIL